MLALESSRVRRILGALGGACCVFFSAAAWGQPVPDEDAAEPGDPADGEPTQRRRRIQLTDERPIIDLATPPPPPPEGREYHLHEGFYLRISGGVGTLLSASLDADAYELTSDGVTLSVEALVGGSPAPGFSVGAGAIGSLQLSGEWDLSGGVGSESADLTTLLVGPFVDGHPEPKGGWHTGGLLGLASVAFEEPGGGSGGDALGFGGAVWVGHDAWVAPEWSVGGALRLDALRATNSDDDVTISAIGATLSFTVLYH